MKKIFSIALIALFSFPVIAQDEKNDCDTTNINLRNKKIIIVNNCDTVINFKKKKSEAHWAGVDFGFTTLMNSSFDNSFSDYPYWKNDAAKSSVWNLNILEHKFEIAKHYFGVTTGLGFSFTSIGFKDNYVLNNTPDTLNAFIDTVTSYTKNKLSAAYLTVPLLFEFNTKAKSSKSFYFAFGVVGGVRIGSTLKRKGEFEGEKFVQKVKGPSGLNAFKLDGLVRVGYSHWGVFASYSLLPLFDTDKTTAVYPLTFGLSINM
jgi:hypothetical protein